MKKNLVFVGDVIDFTDSDSYDLGFKHILRRASSKEIEDIRKKIKPYLPSLASRSINIYEMYKSETTARGFSFGNFQNIEDYRYSVIELPKMLERCYHSTALMLSICDFDISRIFEFRYHEMYLSDKVTKEKKLAYHTSSSNPNIVTIRNFYIDNDIDINLKKINSSIAYEIKILHSNIVAFIKEKDKYPHIYKALYNFNRHKEISRTSPFKMVSLISCLELLLVDSSRDKLNSINKQLQRKINLVNNRSVNPIDFTEYIKGPDMLSIEKIIEIIYSCRSEIAHGTFTYLQDSHEVLKNIDFVSFLDFVTLLTKRMLQQAIIEPDLITDLKKC